MAAIVEMSVKTTRSRLSFADAPGFRLACLHPLLTISCVLALATIVIRAPHFGDPAYHVDEDFYLLVGQSMRAGALPYVDIWDRKPIGLFAFYALIGGGIAQYQLAAGIFAAATALLVTLIARRRCGSIGSVMAGIAYLAAIESLGGGGGQAPVFYNLFVVAAALLTLRELEQPSSGRSMAAMLLIGLALTMKQVAVVEGVFFGVTLLWCFWKRTASLGKSAAYALVLIGCAALPTLIGAIAYYQLGHWSAYWFATVTSIFRKSALPGAWMLIKARYLLLCLAPLLLCAVYGLAQRRWLGAANRETRFLGGWLVAALGGFLAVPNFFDHYALPLAPVLAIAAAPTFARKGTGLLFWLATIGWSLMFSHYPVPSDWGRSAVLHEQASRRIHDLLQGGCLYIYDGPIDLYRTTNACRVTRYLFPEHLNYALEASAIGVDPEAEMRRILARKPRVIVTAETPVVPPNEATRKILANGLARDYRLAASAPVLTPVTPRRLLIWARNPG